MSSERLINGIVQQTTVLIAQVATTAGTRAPLAHLANRVFLDLTEALTAQGLTRKVIADMFGLALRSWQQKIARLQARADAPEESLWEALYGWLRERPAATRADILAAFRQDDDTTVRGLLHDLVESGLVSRSGRGDGAVYRCLSENELELLAADGPEVEDALVWRTVYVDGPIAPSSLAALTSLEPDRVLASLHRLVAEGRVAAEPAEGLDTDAGQEPAYRTGLFVLPLQPGPAWEAALLDHFQAVVSALVAKLRAVSTGSRHAAHMGGSTFRFDIHDEHPYREQLLGQLDHLRQTTAALWDQVQAYNVEHPPGESATGRARVALYFGQSVIGEEDA